MPVKSAIINHLYVPITGSENPTDIIVKLVVEPAVPGDMDPAIAVYLEYPDGEAVEINSTSFSASSGRAVISLSGGGDIG